MLTDSALRAKVDALWDKLWSGGLSNPLDAIEQLSFLLFLKRLDEREQDRERGAKRRGQKYQPLFKPKLRWSHWTKMGAAEALKHVREEVFPEIKTMGGKGGPFAQQMENAEFKINKASLLIEACKAIDDMQISNQNQDVQGDIYEYLLGKLNTAGTNGQFRTPRHIIRMMVKMIDPRPGERMCDPAAGTCGFPVNFYQHVLEANTRKDVLVYDEDGYAHCLVGDKLTAEQHKHLQGQAITAYDSDSGMVMLRIGSMNLMLHGIEEPNFRYTDTLSKAYTEEKKYDVILANPPFKGAIDAADVNPTLPAQCKKTEVLFLHLFLRLLENGGRAAVIVPNGVLFRNSKAHVEIRRKLIEENRLDAVVSMPGGVFRPYAGVSTAVLIFTKGGTTERIWFYDMEHDGLSLDDKRLKVSENDIPDILDCWKNRWDSKFNQKRSQRMVELQKMLAPLKVEQLKHHEIIHRLRFEEVVAANQEQSRVARETAQTELAELHRRVEPWEKEFNQLSRQFWVTKAQAKAQEYDLSANCYRQIEHEDRFNEKSGVTLDRLASIGNYLQAELQELRELVQSK